MEEKVKTNGATGFTSASRHLVGSNRSRTDRSVVNMSVIGRQIDRAAGDNRGPGPGAAFSFKQTFHIFEGIIVLTRSLSHSFVIYLKEAGHAWLNRPSGLIRKMDQRLKQLS